MDNHGVESGTEEEDGSRAPSAEQVLNELPFTSYEDIPEDALCVICQMPALDNVSMCMQGHNACRSCANKWVSADQQNSNKCASCRSALCRPNVPGTGETWMVNTALNNLIRDSKIKCPNVKLGCTHSCKLIDIQDHRSKCGWREIPCKCSGCKWKGPACMWETHMKEEDHGCHLVDMLLYTQQICSTMVDKFENAEEQHHIFGSILNTDVVDPLKMQIDCIGASQNDIKSMLSAIEGYTKPYDGSSARSKRRDRKNQKDVAEAEEKQVEAEMERDDLKRKLEETERDKPSEFERGRYVAMDQDLRNLPSVVQWQQTKESRDRYFKERDLARHESHTAQKRIHDQHQTIRKMMPQVTGSCPCTLVDCDAGGGPWNAWNYARGIALQRSSSDTDLVEE